MSDPILPISSPQFKSFFNGGEANLGVPQPLELLQGTPITPFLLKTFDLVDNPVFDSIISWNSSGNSFVVWDHVEFSRIILPRNFKHSNFSSFVRQLNTYGFRKIDTDRWEFANESFLQGKKHLLKNIQRRRSPQAQQAGGSSNEEGSTALEGELVMLRKEKSFMMQEVINLQQQQCGTNQYMEAVNVKLEAAENRHKQMVSFLGKVCQNPAFVARLREKKEQKNIDSPRKSRKFVKHRSDEQEGKILPSRTVDLNPLPTEHFMVTESKPFLVQNIASNELNEPSTWKGISSLQTEEILLKGVLGSSVETSPQFPVSLPEDLGEGKNNSELFSPETENIVKQEEVWNIGFKTSSGISNSNNEIWGSLCNYDLTEFGVCDGLSNFWDLGSPNMTGGLGSKQWSGDEYPFIEVEKTTGQQKDYSYRNIDP